MVKLDRCLSILDEVATIDFEVFLLGSADGFVARPHVDTWLIIRLFGNKLRFPSLSVSKSPSSNRVYRFLYIQLFEDRGLINYISTILIRKLEYGSKIKKLEFIS